MPRNQPTSPSPPPPGRFSYATGTFDFPHASTSPPPASRSRPPTNSTVDQLTQFLSRRQQEREDSLPQRQPRVDASRRRQASRAIPRHAEREPGNLMRLRRIAPSTVSRPRATPSERYLRRSHARLLEQSSNLADRVDDAGFVIDQLHEMIRQPKRRKLDHHTAATSEYEYYKYGYEGQTVSTRLKMEIMSCDGGEYEMSDSERLYRVQNVLNNDKSVYCSQSSSCNLLLKHIPEAPFCLEKIVIRAPNRGFTAPVQEGLIFVSMTPDNLLSGTAAYELEYTSRSPALSPGLSSLSETEDQFLSLREAIEHAPSWMQSHQAAIEERIERLRRRRGQLQTAMAERDRYREEWRSANAEDETTEYCPYHVDEGDSTAIGVSAPTPPPFTVTTESAQEESDEHEALPSAAVMADRLRRESRWRAETEDEEGGDDLFHRFPTLRRSYAIDSFESRWRSPRSINPIRRAAPLLAPSRIEPKGNKTESEGLIPPHARFFIARHKNKITIKFHPAISGRYVLLKLWSPTHDGNIDIESVQFYGYSGPRFFPAVQPC